MYSKILHIEIEYILFVNTFIFFYSKHITSSFIKCVNYNTCLIRFVPLISPILPQFLFPVCCIFLGIWPFRPFSLP